MASSGMMVVGGASDTSRRARNETREIKRDREDRMQAHDLQKQAIGGQIVYDNTKLQGQQGQDLQEMKGAQAVGLQEIQGKQAVDLQGQKDAAAMKTLGMTNTFTAGESEKQRAFIGGENMATREATAGENALNRQNELIKGRQMIGGNLLQHGVSGDDIQQLESSRPDNLNFTGLQVPNKPVQDQWAPVLTGPDREMTGLVNARTGDVRQVDKPAVNEIGGGGLSLWGAIKQRVAGQGATPPLPTAQAPVATGQITPKRLAIGGSGVLDDYNTPSKDDLLKKIKEKQALGR